MGLAHPSRAGDAVIVRWLVLGLLAAGSAALRALAPAPGPGIELLSLGLILLAGLLAGDLAERLRLPRVTGYLAVGMGLGPSLFGIVPAVDVARLRPFEEIALGLIALTAGGEFSTRIIRSRWKLLAAVTATHAAVIAAVVGGIVWVALGRFPLLGPLGEGGRNAVALLVGVVAVAVSPATTIAVITETRARGDLVDGVLGITILKDLVLLLLFSVASGLALGWTGGHAAGGLGGLAVHVGLSLAAGAALGVGLGAYMRWVGRHTELLVVALALLATEIGSGAALEPLLLCMAAGFTARNLFPSAAEPFLHALERASPPLYIVFFALVGAGLPLDVLLAVGPAALGLAALRLLVVVAATWLPAAAVGGPRVFRRYGWTGFVAQAGLSLGLAARIETDMPGFGRVLSTLIIGTIVINQLAGPVLWRWGLAAAGETGAAAPEA